LIRPESGEDVGLVNESKRFHSDKHTLLAQLDQSTLGQGAADLQTLRDHRGGDQLVGGHFLVQLLVGSLVEQHLVVQLVPDFSLGPLLLLGLAAAGSLLLLLCLLRLLGRRLRVLLRRLKEGINKWLVLVAGIPKNINNLPH